MDALEAILVTSQVAQNKDTQKVNSSNRCLAMIHHQNADAMVLASARLRGIPPPGRLPF
jgi:hypothetical protein